MLEVARSGFSETAVLCHFSWNGGSQVAFQRPPRGPDAKTHTNGARESAGRTAALRRAHVMKLLTWTSAVMLAASSVAVAQPTDTTRISHEPLFTSRDAWIAAGFVAGTIAMYPADRYFARRLQSPHNQENQFLSDAATGLRFMGTPGSMIIGVTMYGAGRLTRVDRLADLGLHGTEALLIAQGTVGILKGLAGRARPEVSIEDERSFRIGRGFHDAGDHYRSFPSGHSAMGFAAAA